jgi:hypothetical protein
MNLCCVCCLLYICSIFLLRFSIQAMFDFASAIRGVQLKKADDKTNDKAKTDSKGGFSVTAADLLAVKLRPRRQETDVRLSLLLLACLI